MHGHEPSSEEARPEGIDYVTAFDGFGDLLKTMGNPLIHLPVAHMLPVDSQTVIEHTHLAVAVVAAHRKKRLSSRERSVMRPPDGAVDLAPGRQAPCSSHVFRQQA